MNQKLLAAIIIIAVASLIVGSVLAISYILETSNPETVDVIEGVVYIPVTLSTNATAGEISDTDTLRLRADVTDPNGLGKLVAFYQDTTYLGSVQIIESSGVYYAVYYHPAPPVGTYVYTAGPPP